MLSERPQPHFSDGAVLAMKNYHFPGNVRELEAVLQRALALAGDQQIHIDDLQLAPLSNDVIIDNQCSLPNQLEEVEKQKILIALENNNGNKTATAKALGISFRALRYRLKKLQIN